MDFDNSWKALTAPGNAKSYFDLNLKPDSFQVDAKDYSPHNAWWLAEISRIIYRREKDEIGNRAKTTSRDDILQEHGLHERFFINHLGHQAGIIEAENRFAVLVFRGSDNLRKLLTDFNFPQKTWSGPGKIHRGFENAFLTIWDQLAEELRKLSVPVFYTGQSLGAAMTTLAAAKLPPKTMYLFGTPRVGNAEFVKALTGFPTYRIVNNLDLVTKVPFSALKFVHLGEEIILSPHPDQADPEFISEPPRVLVDHAPVNYVARLEREIPRHSE